MTYSLLHVSKPMLQVLAAGGVPHELAERALEGALPPPHVAVRALKLGARGHPYPWATTFLVIDDKSLQIIGGCGFKTAPTTAAPRGRVEVGYGIAASAQDRGAASAALKLLTQLAWNGGATEVLAEIVPSNAASIRVVEKCGFVRVGERVDEDGEHVIQWLLVGC